MNSSTHSQGAPVLRQHLPAFRLYLKSEGYSAETIRVYLICLRVLDREAAREGIDLNQLLDRHLNGIPLIVKGKPALTNGFATLIAYLARKKLLVPRGFDAQLNHLLSRYRHFELHEAGLALNTAEIHTRTARRFLVFCFKGGEIRTQTITANVVADYMCQPNHHHKYLAVGLKAFLRFLFQKELINAPLAEGIPTIKSKNKRRLPRSMKPEQLEMLIADLPTASPRERRNRTMIVLLARLGLRLYEVLRLTIDDIDWDAGEVLIRGKGQELTRMPLPEEPARLLFEYITQDRPKSKSREVFLKDRAPHEGIARTTLPIDLKRILKDAGISNPSHTGSRIFRHSFATHMVSDGVAITAVANAMRHRQLNTTMVYARMDIARLRLAARPWPVAEGKRAA